MSLEWFVVLLLVLGCVQACTTGAIGRLATGDGSTYVFGTSDTENSDFRAAKVPAKYYQDGSLKPVYALKQEYPHLVSEERGFTWSKRNLENLPQREEWVESKPFAVIPQVNETYALIETGAGYALMNEFGLTFGESTCGARFIGKPRYDGGHAMFEVGAMMQIAMERSKTSREAIQVMGDLATTYGYYGAYYNDPRLMHDESGETVTIGDGKEAWVFHVTPDDTGKSAVWVAQRVPDDSYAIVANRFIIREVDPNSDDFMFSSNLFDVAERNGLWKKGKKLDFLKVYGPLDDSNIRYATDRIWRVSHLWSPSLKLKTSENRDFPVTFVADQPISLERIISMLRDHYEGSSLDLTQGLASGPYGNPDRYDRGPAPGVSAADAYSESFPRSISLFRSLIYYIQRSNQDLPKEVNARILLGWHEPSETIAVPFYVCAENLPPPATQGSLFQYNEVSMFWVSTLLGNWVHQYYLPIHKFIDPLFEEYETGLYSRMVETENLAASMIKAGKKEAAVALLEAHQNEASWHTLHFLKELFFKVVAKFHDGLEYGDPYAKDVTVHTLFYPRPWLEAVGFLSKPKPKHDLSRVPSMFRASASYAHEPVILVSKPSAVLWCLTIFSMTVAAILGAMYYLSAVKRRRSYIPL